MTVEKTTMLSSALANFDRASALLGNEYPADLIQKLRHPKDAGAKKNLEQKLAKTAKNGYSCACGENSRVLNGR